MKRLLVLALILCVQGCINFDEALSDCEKPGGNCVATPGGGGGGGDPQDAGGGGGTGGGTGGGVGGGGGGGSGGGVGGGSGGGVGGGAGGGGGGPIASEGEVQIADGGLFRLMCSDGGFCWELPLGSAHNLYGVWGNDAGEVWGVGRQGAALHLDSNGWHTLRNGPNTDLYDVVKDPDGTVHIVGVGVVGALTPDGKATWSDQPPNHASYELFSDGTHQIAVGTTANFTDVTAIERQPDGGWTHARFTGTLTGDFQAVAGEYDDLWALGGGPAYHRGADGGWSVDPAVPSYAWRDACLVGGQPWAVSEDTYITRRLSDGGWTPPTQQDSLQQSNAMACASDGAFVNRFTELWFCSDFSTVTSCSFAAKAPEIIQDLHLISDQRMVASTTSGQLVSFVRDAGFTKVSPPRVNARFRAVTRDPRGVLWAVGEFGQVYRRAPTGWVEERAPDVDQVLATSTLTGIAFSPTGKGWVTRGDGKLFGGLADGGFDFNAPVTVTVDGGAFTSSYALNAIVWTDGGFYAVGDNSLVLKTQPNGSWATLVEPTSDNLAAAWAAPDGTLVASGKFGKVIRLPPGATVPQIIPMPPAGTNNTMRAIWGTSPDDFFVAGASQLWHYDGVALTQVTLPATLQQLSRFHAIASADGTELWYLWDDGTRTHISHGPSLSNLTDETLGLPVGEALLVDSQSAVIVGETQMILLRE